MNKFLVLIAFLLTTIVNAQQTTGSIAGKLTDREMNGEPLPFANVTIKGTSTGTTSDYDGLYVLEKIEPGTYTVVFSFVGYETLEIPNVQVVAGKVTEINTDLGSSAAILDEVVIKTVSRRDSEVALLLEQKGAIDIKESIGAQELAKLGVSDAGTATTKISGVTSSEASGDIYVRGLGDRYLYTTMNGLPIPSDDVERKNIDLELFPTRIVQSVGISKTYSSNYSADQVSGNVNISSRELNGTSEFNASIRAGINSNVFQDGINENFKISPNSEDIKLGFYSQDISTENALTEQTWNTNTADIPVNYRVTASGGTKIGDKFKLFLSGSRNTEFEYRKGIFQNYVENNQRDYYSDATTFSKSINTTGLINLNYNLNDNHSFRILSLLVNRNEDIVYEAGRNGQGFTQDEEDETEYSQFVRDQNIKSTKLWVNQIIGEHKFSEKHNLDWAVGANILNADEPNRIRNEVNINENEIRLGRQGNFQNRKSSQTIKDDELSARLNDQINILKEDKTSLTFNIGANYRDKTRDFESVFYGISEPGQVSLNASSIDDLDQILNQQNLDNGLLQVTTQKKPDIYSSNLKSIAGYFSAVYVINDFTFNVGARYQNDEIAVDYDVRNVFPNENSISKSYDNLYPSLNIKYELNEKNNLRFAASKTITLPEFKEIAPFPYVNPRAQVTEGNPDIEASKAYSFDLKWEFFPSNSQLISATAFYKEIKDPIQKSQKTGSSGYFSFFNTSDAAEVYGLELDARIDILKAKEHNNNLDLTMNVTRMWHEQDLKDVYNENNELVRTFKYKDKTTSKLQGASDWIFNAAINFSTNWEKEFAANISANYASDKIFSLGSATNSRQYEIYYSDQIVEKGFVTLNTVISQKINDHWNLRFTGKNLLNPEIKRTQKVNPIGQTNKERTETVNSYTRGSVFNLGISYSF